MLMTRLPVGVLSMHIASSERLPLPIGESALAHSFTHRLYLLVSVCITSILGYNSQGMSGDETEAEVAHN